MTFTKKEWVNVPDPSKLPSVPEGQDALARFDAENMNRIENGLDEACSSIVTHTHPKENVGLGNVPNVATNDQTPTYTEATTLTNITSGEKLSTAFGKIKKAIADLISHLANKNNPHGVNAEKVGLGNVSNTSDADKPVSTLQKVAIEDAKNAGTTAQSNLNAHIDDSVKHITTSERTTWNSKANESHTHTKSQITDFPTSMTPTTHTHTKRQITDFPTSMAPTTHTHTKSQITDFPTSMTPTSHASTATTYGIGTSSNYGHLKITDSKESTATDTAASAKALKETYELAGSNAFKLLKTQAISNISVTTSNYSSPIAVTISGVDLSKYNCIKLVLKGKITCNCPPHHSGGVDIMACNKSLRVFSTNFSVDNGYGKNATGEVSIDGAQVSYYRQASLRRTWYCDKNGTFNLDDPSNYYSVWYTPLVDGSVANAISSYNVREQDNPLKLAIYATSDTFGGTITVNGSVEVYGREV